MENSQRFLTYQKYFKRLMLHNSREEYELIIDTIVPIFDLPRDQIKLNLMNINDYFWNALDYCKISFYQLDNWHAIFNGELTANPNYEPTAKVYNRGGFYIGTI